jgi:hypothetical protein
MKIDPTANLTAFLDFVAMALAAAIDRLLNLLK